ncbi:MAG: sulfur carrier protein ThiS [Mogibacterium sp.]|nr:sulfur carrier protein ThiS [Mogibacterium sp.]
MKLNHREYAGFREGMTIQDVIEESRFTWPNLVVVLNGKVIKPEDYDGTLIDVRDDLEVIHLLAGG